MGDDQKRALLAVVLSGAVLFGWQYFFVPKQAPVVKPKVEQSIAKTDSNITPDTGSNSGPIEPKPVAPIGAKTFKLSNRTVSYTFNSNLAMQQAYNENASFTYDELFQSQGRSLTVEFKVGNSYRPLSFNVDSLTETTAKLSNAATGINGTLELSENGFLDFKFSSTKDFSYRFFWNESAQKLENGQIKSFSIYSDDLTNYTVGDDDKGDTKVLWAGVDFNYHLLSVVFPTENNYLFKTTESGTMVLTPSTSVKNLDFKLIFTKKEYDTLLGLGSKLHRAVDFGIWSIIAVPILRGLQFFYDIFPNWGISIILLTLIIRTLTFPLQYKSFKSMKKMQVIQPELTKIREKFKQDPQRMQSETMALFKQAGANPLGGCLPLLLQMPIFFAFYKVLYSSVELVQAPFYLWIHDLSEKDPYYILPVLMGAAMFLHQKVTPTATADPMQKKVMMFMPVIFALFMKDLPAGLTLYIFVSTIMGLLQQLIVYRRT